MASSSKILVIKYSALGDVILALGAFRAIRDHHGNDQVILLTSAPYVGLARGSGCFDEIWVDERPKLWRPDRWLELRRRLRQAKFARVYDLQHQDRTGWMFRLLGPNRPEWVGKVRGCSHRYVDPPEAQHATDRQAQMLSLAGIERVPPPDLSFAESDVGHFGLDGPYALLVPGCSPRRPEKRWPSGGYIEIARALAADSITPVLIGGPAEAREIGMILAACPAARKVSTDLGEIIGLARKALFAVGNDTGPMHIISASGCPVLVLFSEHSDPVKVRPTGPAVTVLRAPRLADLSVSEVLNGIREIRPNLGTAPAQ